MLNRELVDEMTLKQLIKAINCLRENKIPITSDYLINKYERKIWFSKTNRFIKHLHALDFIQYAIEYYHKFNDDIGIQKVLAIFYLWYEENYPYSKNKVCFQKDVVSKRLLNICELLVICKTNDLCILDDVFIKVITSHISYQLSNYIQKHINGIYQDISIIKAIYYYNRYYIKNSFINELNYCMSRLKTQIDYFIQEASYIGNSLKECYQLFAHLYELYEFLVNNNELVFSKYLKTKLDELYYFIYNLTYPGGLYDHSLTYLNRDLILNYPHHITERFLQLFTNKQDNIRDVILYEQANIFIYHKNYKLIFFNNFPYVRKKKHNNLHFEIFYKDNLLLTTINKHHLVKGRNYNNIIVDSHDFLIDMTQVNLCALTNYAHTLPVSYISGFHLLYEDVLIKRSLLLFYQHIIIIDEIFSNEKHDYEINFHFHKDYLLSLTLLYTTSKIVNMINENTVTYKFAGKEVIVVNSIKLNPDDEEIKLYVNEEEIIVDDLIIKRGRYYNDLFYHNKMISRRLKPKKFCIKALFVETNRKK